MRILVVDDHPETRTLLVRNLERASHAVKTAGSCGEAEAALTLGKFEAVVLDVMLPDGSGIDLCRHLRAARVVVPILLLTARGQIRDRVDGLEAGADDYLVKPFAIVELLARVKALGRRGPVFRDRAIAIGPIQVDLERRRVRASGRVVPLTARELAIMEVLASRRGGVVAREHLLESVWGTRTTPRQRASRSWSAGSAGSSAMPPGLSGPYGGGIRAPVGRMRPRTLVGRIATVPVGGGRAVSRLGPRRDRGSGHDRAHPPSR